MDSIQFYVPEQTGEFLAWLTALAVIIIGLGLMLVPRPLMAWLGLSATRPDGISEVRGPFGGIWVGLGVSCILLAQPLVYLALGISFVVAVIGRILSFVADRSVTIHVVVATLFEAASAYFPIAYALGWIA